MRGLDAAVAWNVAPAAIEPSCRVPPLAATSKNRLLPEYRPVSTVGGSTTSTTSPPVAVKPPNAVTLLALLSRIRFPTAVADSRLAITLPFGSAMVPAACNTTVPAFSTPAAPPFRPSAIPPEVVFRTIDCALLELGVDRTEPAATVPTTGRA